MRVSRLVSREEKTIWKNEKNKHVSHAHSVSSGASSRIQYTPGGGRMPTMRVPAAVPRVRPATTGHHRVTDVSGTQLIIDDSGSGAFPGDYTSAAVETESHIWYAMYTRHNRRIKRAIVDNDDGCDDGRDVTAVQHASRIEDYPPPPYTTIPRR